MARRSASSSAPAMGEPAKNAIAAMSPPPAAALLKFRFLVIAPPTKSSCVVSSLFSRLRVSVARISGYRPVLALQYQDGGADQAPFGAQVVFSSQRGQDATFPLKYLILSPLQRQPSNVSGVCGARTFDQITLAGCARGIRTPGGAGRGVDQPAFFGCDYGLAHSATQEETRRQSRRVVTPGTVVAVRISL